MRTTVAVLTGLLAASFALAARAQLAPPPLDQLYSASCTVPCTTAVIPTSGYAQVAIQASGTGGTIAFTFEGTMDNGVTWQTLPAVVPAVPGVWVTSFSANGIWIVPSASFQKVRVNLSAIATGTETFSLAASVRTNLGMGL